MAGTTSNDLELLERVFLRFGTAETDEQLESTLARFLCPVLLKLESNQDGARKKVMELLVHINKRVKSRPHVKLPLGDLLKQYQEQMKSTFISNFTTIYIKLGYPRLEKKEQIDLIPSLLKCMEDRPLSQQASFLQLLVPALQFWDLASEPEKLKTHFDSGNRPKLVKVLLDFFLDFLLLPYNHASGKTAEDNPEVGKDVPAGLSLDSYQRLIGDTPLYGDELEHAKIGVIKLLGRDFLPDQDIICHLVVALADPRHKVSMLADREVKRLTGRQDWNNPAIISKLYSVFLGTMVMKGNKEVPENLKRKPGSPSLRLKLFPIFLKSKEAANQFPACIQITFDCLFGDNTNAKLKSMAVQFVHHLCFNCTGAKFNTIGQVLPRAMLEIGEDTKLDKKLRSQAFVAIGKVFSRMPQSVSKNMHILQNFFESMGKEEPDIRLSMQEALSMMAPACKNVDEASQKLLEALIMQNIDKAEPQSRLIAVQFASSVFALDHIPSKYVLLLGCGDIKEDIFIEASKSLKNLPVEDENNKDENRKLMPGFPEMVSYIAGKAKERMRSSQKYVAGNVSLPFNPVAYGEILIYLRMCLAYNSGVHPNIESTTTMQAQAPTIAKYITSLVIKESVENTVLVEYLNMIKQILNAIGGPPVMYCLLEMVAMGRHKFVPMYVSQIDWIKGFMFGSKEDMREFASELYAIVVATAQARDQLVKHIKDLTANLKHKMLETQHGSLLGLGYLIGCMHRIEKSNDMKVEDMEIDSEEDSLFQAITQATSAVVTMLKDSNSTLSMGACIALSEMGRNGPLYLKDKDGEVSKLSLTESLSAMLQSSKTDTKVRDKVSVCMGLLCVGDPKFAYRQKIIDGLLDCAEIRQVEFHFTVGEALVNAALGHYSPSGRDFWTKTEKEFSEEMGIAARTDNEIGSVLKILMTKHLVSPNPHIRQAACIWLLTLVQKCGEFDCIQSKLQDIQSSFMDLLSESNDITQDLASKGLGIVYDKCSKDLKDILVGNLVDSLMTGKRVKRDVTGETKVFEEGSMGKTPDGKGLSTYKELCSIANDLNQPDLIYKFMHLANHNAVWNSRKGAAVGFSTIAKQAGEQLTPHMHKIVPKLYRYQFDPNPRIQQAMSSIWTALVTDVKTTTEKYLPEIMDDLLMNLTNREWRVRESSCMAVHDLLRGRTLDSIIDKLPELWETLFRVRDDIKESVRNAAEIALQTLSKVSIRLCDHHQGKIGIKATKIILPCLLEKGLSSTVEEIRGLSLSTIMEMSYSAGALLKPHIPELTSALLEGLSAQEPRVLNYLSVRAAGSDGNTQDRLDAARLAVAKSSPMMETINFCIDHVDEKVLALLINRLLDLLKRGIGLGTKVGCSSVIIRLTHHCPRELTPYSGKLLAALLSGLNDRNATIRKSYADTIGNLVKVSKDSSVEKLLKRLQEKYMASEEDNVRTTCGLTMHAINEYAHETLLKHGAVALPFCFLASHAPSDSENDRGKIWLDIWDDCVNGTMAGLKLYLKELVELFVELLDSSSWSLKTQASVAIKALSIKIPIDAKNLEILMNTLLKASSGRTYPGKESILLAISSLVVHNKQQYSPGSEQGSSLDAILEALFRECRKEKIFYKTYALQSISEVLQATQTDRFQHMVDVIYPLLDRNAVGDDDDDGSSKREFAKCQTAALEALGASFPKTASQTQMLHQEEMINHLCKHLDQGVKNNDIVVLDALLVYIDTAFILQKVESANEHKSVLQKQVERIMPKVISCIRQTRWSSTRVKAIALSLKLFKQLAVMDNMDLVVGEHLVDLREVLQAASTDPNPECGDKALQVLEIIK